MNSTLDVVGESRPVLYTKIGCPWCAEARAVLDRQGIVYDERSVTTDATATDEMRRVSGQTKAPVLDWSGEILADFGALELETFLVAHATGAFTAGGGS
jgi:glutaredoxin 3